MLQKTVRASCNERQLSKRRDVLPVHKPARVSFVAERRIQRPTVLELRLSVLRRRSYLVRSCIRIPPPRRRAPPTSVSFSQRHPVHCSMVLLRHLRKTCSILVCFGCWECEVDDSYTYFAKFWADRKSSRIQLGTKMLQEHPLLWIANEIDNRASFRAQSLWTKASRATQACPDRLRQEGNSVLGCIWKRLSGFSMSVEPNALTSDARCF